MLLIMMNVNSFSETLQNERSSHPPPHQYNVSERSHGQHHQYLGLPVSAHRYVGLGLGRQDHSALPAQVQRVREHGAHQLQQREDQTVQWHRQGLQLPLLGSARPGEATVTIEAVAAVEVL
ncbi:mCG1051035 [Mus musculus]|nr:mCG1051035 [Mus musculus]